MSSGNKFIDDQIAAAGALLAQRWQRGERPQMPENNLDGATQKYELRVKMLEDRCDRLEQIIKRAGLLK